ncbi:MAG: hypothetical protein CVV27_06610 [Candidatus Melainabacteria bacterium HGW-Melainabacteria-1]|nr:MAG: hypothetical protein CVV27_06610 [Candidatus Melainabacteria bacterium HGW-Melainabacteria-1]
MRYTILFALSVSILSACQGPTALSPRPLQAANVSSASAPAPVDARYSFRKPVGTMKFDLYHSSDRTAVNAAIKEFFRKYVDQNDIVNYQMVDQQGVNDAFFLNIFGGNKDFVLNRLLPDLRGYLQQRSRFDSISFYAS